MQDWSEQMIPLFFHEYFNVSVSLKFSKRKPSKQTDKKLKHLIHMTFSYWYFQVYNYRGSLDSCKIDKNNQTLLDLRNRSVNEQNKPQDTGGEDDANKSDVTAATEKTLDNGDETTLRGKEF